MSEPVLIYKMGLNETPHLALPAGEFRALQASVEALKGEVDRERFISRRLIADMKEYADILGIDTTREGDEPGQIQILHAIQDTSARLAAAEGALRCVVEALDGAISIRCAEAECGGECVREALAMCRAALAATPPAAPAPGEKGGA